MVTTDIDSNNNDQWLINNTGLGEGAQRVEHVEADFLTKPEEIANSLKKKVKKV